MLDLHHGSQTHSGLCFHGLEAEGQVQFQQDGAYKLPIIACLAITRAMKMTPNSSSGGSHGTFPLHVINEAET